MGIGSIQMNLDFAFNTSGAIKNAAKLSGGMGKLLEVSKLFVEKAKIIETDYSRTFNGVYDQIIKNANGMGILGANTEAALNGIYGLELKTALDDIYSSQLAITSGMKGISKETATWASSQALIESLRRTSDAADAFAKTFEKVGLSVEGGTGRIISQLTALHSTNEKAFKKLTKVMAEADELADGLNPKQAAQYRQHMSQLSDAFSRGEITANAFITSQDRLNYRFEVMNKRLPMLKQQIGGLFSGTRGQIIGTLGAFAVLDDALSSQQQTVETTHRLALANNQIFTGQAKTAASFHGTVMTMNSAIRDIGGQTQISMTKASEAMNALAEARIPGTIDDLKNLTITSVKMSQAFGISEGQAADLFKTLSLAGNLSPAGINEVAEALADVQAVWGLTGAEATEAAAQVGNVINRMSRMGAASIKNAKIVAREVGRMTTAFTRAGMSANEASQMMDRFMDPSKIEENAYLWHTMGLTVSDGLAMMTGDAAAMEGMTEKMMKSAVNLKKEYGNNPLALQAMAEAMGMTVQMVNQLASEYEREANMTSDMRKELEVQATLESQAAQARASAAQALQKLAAIGNVFMQTFVMPLIDLLTPLIIGIGKMAQGINGFLDALGPVGGILKGAMGAVLLFTMISGINIFKLAAPVNGLGGAFSGLLGKAKDLAIQGVKAISTFATEAAKRLGSGPLSKALEGVGDKLGKLSTGPASKITKSVASDKVTPPTKSNKFMEGMAKLPAKNLMMVGAATLMVAGAIFLLSLSLKTLVEVIQGATAGEIFSALGIMAIMVVGLGLAVFVASKLFTASAPGLLIFGGAMLMVAGAVAIMVLSLSVLMNTIKDMNPAQIAIGLGALALALSGLIIMASIMAPIAATAGVGLLAFGSALLMVGGAVVLVGLGFMLMALSVKILVDAINNLGPAFASNVSIVAAGVAALIIPLTLLSLIAILAVIPIAALGLALFVMGLGMAMVSASIKIIVDNIKAFTDGLIYLVQNTGAVVGGFIIIAASVALALLIIGTAAGLVGGNLLILGASVALIGAGFILAGIGLKLFVEAIAKIGENAGQFIINALVMASAITIIGLALGAMGAFVALAGPGILILAGAFVVLGIATMALGLGMDLMAKSFNKFIEMGDRVVPTAMNIMTALLAISAGMLAVSAVGALFGFAILGLLAIIPGLLLLGLAMNNVSNNFMNMGTGVKLFADNIGAVLTGIDQLKQKLSGITGMSNTFVEEIGKMTDALSRLQNFAGGNVITGMITMLMKPSKASSEKDNDGNSAMMEKMDTIVEHLSNISAHTLRTAVAVEGMEKKMNSAQTFSSSPRVNLA